MGHVAETSNLHIQKITDNTHVLCVCIVCIVWNLYSRLYLALACQIRYYLRNLSNYSFKKVSAVPSLPSIPTCCLPPLRSRVCIKCAIIWTYLIKWAPRRKYMKLICSFCINIDLIEIRSILYRYSTFSTNAYEYSEKRIVNSLYIPYSL